MPRCRTPLMAAALLALAACDAPRTPPAVGTSAGTAEAPSETAARAVAGEGCPATTQGTARLVTRGDGPVVLRSGTAAGTASRPGDRQPVPASGATGSGGCQ